MVYKLFYQSRFIVLTILMLSLVYIAIPTYAGTAHQQTADGLYKWVLFHDGDVRYTYLTHAGDSRLFVVEQRGRIVIFQNGTMLSTPFLDIQSLVNDGDNEQGLLSMAFDPNYTQNGYFYVNYTDNTNATRVVRYQVSANPNIANANSAQNILTVSQPFTNHNGGQLQFGADGYLYIGMGDGGSGNDPQNNAQNKGNVLGAMLRIDVSGDLPYEIPPNNPFANDPNARPEIWAYGLRNPWRFSFDRQTHDLYIADVGQNSREEVNFQPASSSGGENYGWRFFEGNNGNINPPTDTSPFVFPVAEYSHSQGCSITGGYVYRGISAPALQGKYFYGDFCTGIIWTLTRNGNSWTNELFLDTTFQISSFGEDVNGELYILDFNSFRIWKLVAAQTMTFLDTPPQSAVLPDSFIVAGWAVDPAAGNGGGTGVDLVRVYQGTACTGTMLGETIPNIARPDVAAAFGLDASYTNSGFVVPLSGLPNGALTFTTCIRSTFTNAFTTQITRTVTIQNTQTLMFVDTPPQSAVLPDNFIVAGWAVDPAAGNGGGTGVDLVRVYQGTACTGTMLGETIPNIARPDVAAAFGLDASYTNSGFGIPLSGLPNGALTFTACARSTLTNTFTTQVTRTVTIQNTQTLMFVDTPPQSAVLPDSFIVAGWAVDPAAGSGGGTGVNLIRVYQGTACTGTMLGETIPNIARPDVAAAFGLDASYTNSGFVVPLSGLPNGALTFTTCARSTLTNTFTTQVTRTVTIQNTQTLMFVDTPPQSAVLPDSFIVAGWAVDPAAGSGGGTGVDLVRVYQGTACTGTMLGEIIPNIARPDVAAAFGLDASYTNSGFVVPLSGLPDGALTFTTCARSTLTNTFTTQVTRTVTISSGFAGTSTSRIEAEDHTHISQEGNWTIHGSPAASGSAYVSSSGTAQDSLSLTFSGTQVSVMYVQNPNLGRIAIEIDGVVIATIDLEGVENFGEQAVITHLEPGEHTLRLVAVEGIAALDAILLE